MNITIFSKLARFFIKPGCLILTLLVLLTACGQSAPRINTPASQSLPPTPSGANFSQQTLPARIHLPVTPVSQLPELPNGCEATSLAMVLTYYGFETDKMEIAERVLPKEGHTFVKGIRQGPHPNEKYAGDPTTEADGYYCFPPVVVKGAANYLTEQGRAENFQIEDISGSQQQDLEQLVSQGVPLIIWAAKEYSSQPIYSTNGWYLPNDEFYTPFSNLHCAVLVGYTSSEFILCDPLENETYLYVDKQTFMESYNAMGSMALSIQELPA